MKSDVAELRRRIREAQDKLGKIDCHNLEDAMRELGEVERQLGRAINPARLGLLARRRKFWRLRIEYLAPRTLPPEDYSVSQPDLVISLLHKEGHVSPEWEKEEKGDVVVPVPKRKSEPTPVRFLKTFRWLFSPSSREIIDAGIRDLKLDCRDMMKEKLPPAWIFVVLRWRALGIVVSIIWDRARKITAKVIPLGALLDRLTSLF